MYDVPIFERLTTGWVNDNIGLFFLLEQFYESGNITLLGSGLPMVGGRRTGMWPKVIGQLKNWVFTLGFDNGRCWCWVWPLCTRFGSDLGMRHRVRGGFVGVNY